jgi:hypothetical protein
VLGSAAFIIDIAGGSCVAISDLPTGWLFLALWQPERRRQSYIDRADLVGKRNQRALLSQRAPFFPTALARSAAIWSGKVTRSVNPCAPQYSIVQRSSASDDILATHKAFSRLSARGRPKALLRYHQGLQFGRDRATRFPPPVHAHPATRANRDEPAATSCGSSQHTVRGTGGHRIASGLGHISPVRFPSLRRVDDFARAYEPSHQPCHA